MARERRFFAAPLGDGSDELYVLSLGLPSWRGLPLSDAECEIVAGLLDGLSVAAIAKKRRRATHTVANQVARIYGKLGVQSRAELLAVVCGPTGPATDGER